MGFLFLSDVVYQAGRGGLRDGASPYKTLLGTPRPGYKPTSMFPKFILGIIFPHAFHVPFAFIRLWNADLRAPSRWVNILFLFIDCESFSTKYQRSPHCSLYISFDINEIYLKRLRAAICYISKKLKRIFAIPDVMV